MCWLFTDFLNLFKVKIVVLQMTIILNSILCFFLQPNRTYYLMDPSGNADRWCKKIYEVWRKIYQRHQNPGL